MNPRRLLFLLLCAAWAAGAQSPHKTRNVILVTGDGIRWQDVFRGMDPALENAEETAMKNADGVRERFSAASARERRVKLMPFFWTDLVREGVLLGNQDQGSVVKVTNGHSFSYPGYAEIVTGSAQDAIDSNDLVPNPAATLLEILRQEWKLDRRHAALFGSWEVFRGIGAQEGGSVLINAGFQAYEEPGASQHLRRLSAMQFELLTPWPSVRHDFITLEMALEYLKTEQPRVLYVALGETDDWAHEKRYDRYLETLHYFDQSVGKIWRTLQEIPAYRGTTTLLVTTDHGRGPDIGDWNSHGRKVPGADSIWIAAMGPDTPATGEASKTAVFHQRDVTPTLLNLAGVDVGRYPAMKGKPIPLVTGH